MQTIPALPAMPTEPMAATPPAASKPAAETIGKKQFSQHLTTARTNIAEPSQNKKTGPGKGEQAATEMANPVGPSNEEVHALDELSHFAANGISPVFGPEQNLLPGWPVEENNSLINGKPADHLTLAQILQEKGGTSITASKSILMENLGLKYTQQQLPLGQSTVQQQVPLGQTTGQKQVPLGPDNGQQVPSASLAETTAANPGKNNVGTELTIEHWKAQFRHHSVTHAQGTENPRFAFTKPLSTGKDTVQEPILAYTSAEFTELAAPSRAKGGSGIQPPALRQDANSNFIHSNLPGVTAKTDSNANKGTQQQNDGGQKNMTPDILPQTEQTTAAKSGQETPLIFSLNQEPTPGLNPQSQTATTAPMLRLPSGSEVPHSQIVNQVIDRFTLNRTLESGTITLKLHPQELGELRMEIKIEQDNIKAHITTQNPQVQEILDRHLPRLREALEAQGLNLEHMEVSVAADGHNNPQLFQEHFSRQQTTRPQQKHNEELAFSLDEELPIEEPDSSGKHKNLSVLI